jgi:hypothetical protein
MVVRLAGPVALRTRLGVCHPGLEGSLVALVWAHARAHSHLEAPSQEAWWLLWPWASQYSVPLCQPAAAGARRALSPDLGSRGVDDRRPGAGRAREPNSKPIQVWRVPG